MTIFLRMLITHLLSDFALQSDKSVICRKENLWQSRYLYIHASVYAILVGAASFAWEYSWVTSGCIVIILFASHVLIDGFKVTFTDNLPNFFVDQLIHITILAAIAAYLSPEGFNLFILPLQTASASEEILAVLLGFFILLWPTGVVISYLIRPFKKDISSEGEKRGIDKAGLWIGFLERFLTYGFIVAGYPQAIGLLVAGKSVFRFGEIKKDNRAEVEYILIGSLLSFAAALAVGQLVKMFIA
jgi:hypothetical protein